jgi:hypothetical protein
VFGVKKKSSRVEKSCREKANNTIAVEIAGRKVAATRCLNNARFELEDQLEIFSNKNVLK